MLTRRGLLLAGGGATLVVATPGAAGQRTTLEREPPRVGTWAAAPTAVPVKKVLTLDDQTVRQVLHTSIGGDLPQLTLSNEYGAEPVRIGAARIGVRTGGLGSSATVPGSDRPLTFNGSPAPVLAPGQVLVSDPADLVIEAGADVVVSLHLPERVRVGTISPRAKQENLIVAGDATARPDPGPGKTITRYLWVTGLSVRAVRAASAIVALGDSITCGTATTDNANHRWPDLLAARLRVEGLPRGVLNAGLSGNRLLFGYEDPTGSADKKAYIGAATFRRFARDVLTHPGVGHVIVLIGVNDLANKPARTTGEMIAGHRELILRSRAAGIRVIGGTLLPFAGASDGLDTQANQRVRAELNAWIRGGGEYDGVIDFDAALRDPNDPWRLNPRYDSGDGLHPNDEGTAALAAAVPLNLLGD
ncbi:SGNH/GDSL hydrolase family protein [Actinoplanes hulinensis]|uniref:SGNH/GDSL hydrolase family protein n=1 Tax=Actinoplanes hulinensis TaxID=1144547 RepID=A0ABS7B183_9ACTN|nr:SGNH/GDSL hydrolase family protein [Actinoplanes hulinensis]MBW6434745.1 SGNH/GDSL hydrolase family protein [Actinoplanes hulinensis]